MFNYLHNCWLCQFLTDRSAVLFIAAADRYQ